MLLFKILGSFVFLAIFLVMVALIAINLIVRKVFNSSGMGSSMKKRDKQSKPGFRESGSARKIFSKGDGEYVDFEEIKDDGK